MTENCNMEVCGFEQVSTLSQGEDLLASLPERVTNETEGAVQGECDAYELQKGSGWLPPSLHREHNICLICSFIHRLPSILGDQKKLVKLTIFNKVIVFGTFEEHLKSATGQWVKLPGEVLPGQCSSHFNVCACFRGFLQSGSSSANEMHVQLDSVRPVKIIPLFSAERHLGCFSSIRVRKSSWPSTALGHLERHLGCFSIIRVRKSSWPSTALGHRCSVVPSFTANSHLLVV